MISVDAARLLGGIRTRESALASFGSTHDAQNKILFVEGRLDNFVFSSMITADTRIVSAGIVNNFYKNTNHGLCNVKKAIVDAVSAASTDEKYKLLKVYGVIDRDYEDAFKETDCLFITDTNDLETLLFLALLILYLE